MSKSNSLETGLLALIFNATPYGTIADNDAAAPATNLYVSLHTSDPGEAGTQVTNEANYTGYARAAVARTSGGWTVSGNSVVNAATVTWPACTAGSSTCTHFGIGIASGVGAGELLYSGAISDPAGGLAVTAGITPSAAAGALSITED